MRHKKILYLFILLLLTLAKFSFAAPPDFAYIFAYSTEKNSGRNGLHFAWSIDKENWFPVGPEHRFLFCDYGRWGKEKRLVDPFLFLDKNNLWHCVWSVNEYDGVFAHSASKDLVYWYPQTYPNISTFNCLLPVINYDSNADNYIISWVSSEEGVTSQIYKTTTTDFKTYSRVEKISHSTPYNFRNKAIILGNEETGTIHKVSWTLIDNLIKTAQLADYKRFSDNQYSKDDAVRFAGLKPVNAEIKVNTQKEKKISDMLIGVFFEDINYAADGGLYAELIQNRDFEYDLSDKEGKDTSWNHEKTWSVNGQKIKFSIDTVLPIHYNNKHYAVLKINETGGKFINDGFDGISVKGGEKYDFSLFAKNPDSKNKILKINLIDESGNVFGTTKIKIESSNWKKYTAVITSSKSASNLQLEITPQNVGTLNLDMISLFPQKTFKNRKNGLRADLAQTIADIHPRFVRFPGGCVSHGDGLDNIYRWKNTVGTLESRKPQRNLWGYHQTTGLGYYEYFQFCEDIGAEPLPVVAAGVPCQNSATGGAGQQGGIPMCEMDNYVQDILDLIEWANGSQNTKWGKVRAQAGHPKPFNLKYIGIGNEDLINDIFEERFTKIYNVIKEKHPEITIIGTVGPASEGTDYVEGWKIADKLQLPMVDEHYYQPPGWFVNNYDFYDKYDRSKSKVYLGEYAAHLPGRPNNVETATAEALYLATLERNGDIVSMASYAPMLAKEKHTQWNPDLIYFNNDEVKTTVGYYVQQLYGANSGDFYVSNEIKLSNNDENVKKHVVISVVRDSKTNDLILKMINILPIELNAQIKLNTEDIQNIGVRTVLTGAPQDKKAKPQINNIAVSNDFACQLPPYSFTVIRVKKTINLNSQIQEKQ